jgi:hypothetical protein
MSSADHSYIYGDFEICPLGRENRLPQVNDGCAITVQEAADLH